MLADESSAGPLLCSWSVQQRHGAAPDFDSLGWYGQAMASLAAAIVLGEVVAHLVVRVLERRCISAAETPASKLLHLEATPQNSLPCTRTGQRVLACLLLTRGLYKRLCLIAADRAYLHARPDQTGKPMTEWTL